MQWTNWVINMVYKQEIRQALVLKLGISLPVIYYEKRVYGNEGVAWIFVTRDLPD